MTEPLTGTLVWQAKGKSRRPIITYTTPKGKLNTQAARGAQLAPALRQPRSEPVEVWYELEQGHPVCIRPVGEMWAAPPEPSPSPLPQRAEHTRERNSQARDSQGDRRTAMPVGKFHNPYGFAEALDRDTRHPELGDHPPASHARFQPERYSGRIPVRMTVATPLLLPDASRAELDEGRQHRTFPVRVGRDGRPYLPPTSVKGMLRTAYETITNSRFGVFTGHKDPLARRMDAREGLSMVPARVEDDSRLSLYLGTTSLLPTMEPRGWSVPGTMMYAAWLPRYDRTNGGIAKFAVRYPDGSLPEHGEEAICWLEKFQHLRWGKKQQKHVHNFYYWRVRTIARKVQGKPNRPAPGKASEGRQGRGHHRPVGDPLIEVHGYVCITNQNINRKHDERVFFTEPGTAPRFVSLDERLRRQWEVLIRDYQAIHERDLDKRRRAGIPCDRYRGSKPGETAWSRHVCERNANRLVPGTLCYARINEVGRVEGLYPVMIARELFEKASRDLLHQSVRPATHIAQLSPADRVFGWVRQDGDEPGALRQRIAYRGNLRIGAVDARKAVVESFDRPVPLAILGAPKPAQGRFYLVARDGRPLDRQSPDQAGYHESNRVRGRKLYPHHRLEPSHWRNPWETRFDEPENGVFQEYRRRPDGSGEDRHDQNRSIAGWVPIGATFRFDVHVTNLSIVELGALLWLLDLARWQQLHLHLRLGGGKPLGFGSVHLELDNRPALTTGDRLRDYYLELREERPAVGDADLDNAVRAFKDAICQAYGGEPFETVPFVADFLTAARGYDDGLPVHYPRVRPQESHLQPPAAVPPAGEGEGFKWFVENARGQRLALPRLREDRGLPMLQERSPIQGRQEAYGPRQGGRPRGSQHGRGDGERRRR